MTEDAGRIVLITGADGGIGAEIARSFVADGAHVWLGGIRPESGRSLASRLGERATWIELDVSRDDHWARVMLNILARDGRLDVLVNNAGYLVPGLDLENTTLDEWHRHFAVNVDGQFLGCQHGIQAMKATGGAIVNMSSAVAVRMHAHAPAYGVSKSAVHALTKVAALHCNQKHYGIRVNTIMPGPVDTPMMRTGIESPEAFAQVETFLKNKYAMDRIGVPQDIANMVRFVCSPANSYVTGAAFTVDGGQSA